MTTKAAIIGSGNIGTDLLVKTMRRDGPVEVVALVGIDPTSDGLARARRLGVKPISSGIDGLLSDPDFDEVEVVFDATSAAAHRVNAARLADTRIRIIDLTPAALGPFVVPTVNLHEHTGASNVNMVTCGGQATIPMVAAVSQVADVAYAEIVASIASRSAGPGTRANIDEFTETTAHAIEGVGGARRGKAIVVLNPAEPPVIMRDTVLCLVDDCDRAAVVDSVERMTAQVQRYVPGYRLAQPVQFRDVKTGDPENQLADGAPRPRLIVSIFLEVEGAGHYLPAYAGNLDIMTSAALHTAERLSEAALA